MFLRGAGSAKGACKKFVIACLLLYCIRALSLVDTCAAQSHIGKIVPSDVQRSDFFGSEIEASGSWIFVSGGSSVYVFESNGMTWFERAVLTSPAPLSPGDLSGFGACVSVSGRWALIGAPHELADGDDSGAAYVFEWTGRSWSVRDRLVPTDPKGVYLFGSACSIDGNRATIGASADDVSESAVYVFEWNGESWNQTAKLQAHDDSRSFGRAVAIEGTRILVGTLSDEHGQRSGSARVYDWTGTSWHRTAMLVPPGLEGGDRFSRVVALDGDFAVAGARGQGAGAVYVYQSNHGNWDLDATLFPDPGDTFGHSISLAGDRLAIGANSAPLGPVRGSIYLYERIDSAWIRMAKLVPPEEPGWEFGAAIALSGSGLIYVGDPSDAEFKPWNGAVHVFELAVEPPNGGANRFQLDGNYPNPFRSVTWLRLNVPEQIRLQVTVYDLLGRRVYEKQVRLRASPSEQFIRLDMPYVSAGMYTYSVSSTGNSDRVTEFGLLVIVD